MGTMPTWPGSEEGMIPTSDGELRQSQLQKQGGEVPFGKLVTSVPSRHSAVPSTQTGFIGLFVYINFFFFFFLFFF